MRSRLAAVLGFAALATFAYVLHRVWEMRPEPISVSTAFTHPHLLGMTHGDRHALFVSGAAAVLCFAAIPLLRVGAAGTRGWRGALPVAAAMAVLLIAGGVYRYDHPSLSPRCLAVTASGRTSTICQSQPNMQEAIRQTKYLSYGAVAVVVLTLLSAPALRAVRRLA
jgi:hypothetical protein